MTCECGKEMTKIQDKPEAWFCLSCESTKGNVLEVDISTNGDTK